MSNTEQEYWDNIYSLKKENELSWYQPYPEISMDFIESFNLPLSAKIIDIGGGDSRLAGALLKRGYQNIWVLDISTVAIERAKQRLGEKASGIQWLVSDVTIFEPTVQFDLWHDRATFHFLTGKEKISAYTRIVEQSVKNKGYLLAGVFSQRGPTKCSGLDIRQYSAMSLTKSFEKSFEPISCVHTDHITPSKTTQNFLFCSFKKK
jgi:hypothetical protein